MPGGSNEIGAVNHAGPSQITTAPQPNPPTSGAGNLNGRSVELQRASSARAPSPEAGASRPIAAADALPADGAGRWQGGQRANDLAGLPAARSTVIGSADAEHRQLSADLRSLQALGKDLQRWKALPSALAKQLRQVESHLNGNRLDQGRALLNSIDTEIRALHAPLRHKRDFKADVARLQKPSDAIAKFAAGVTKHFPGLKALLAAYESAKRAARYDAKASNAELRSRIDSVAATGAQLVEALVAQVDQRARAESATRADLDRQTQLRDLLDSTYADTIERGRYAKPANFEQLITSRWLATAIDLPFARVPLRQMQMASGLLSAQRPAASHEAQYFRQLRAQETRLKAVQDYGAMARGSQGEVSLTTTQREVIAELDATLQRLPAWRLVANGQNRDDVIAAETEQCNRNPARYTQALADLQRATELAERLVGLSRGQLGEQIDALDTIVEPGTKAARALELFQAHSRWDNNLIILGALMPAQQVKLLSSLRGGRGVADLPNAVREAQSRIYKALPLDGGFQQLERRVRKQVIAALTTEHKHTLRRAQAEWPRLTDAQKLQVMNLITATYCDVAGFRPPRIEFGALEATIGGEFKPATGKIIVNSKHAGLHDFEAMMDTIFHENSHNWQYQMMDSVRTDPVAIAAGDPRREQTMLFAANRDFYDVRVAGARNPHLAYREQPLEAHAFLAGRKFARGLIKALNT